MESENHVYVILCQLENIKQTIHLMTLNAHSFFFIFSPLSLFMQIIRNVCFYIGNNPNKNVPDNTEILTYYGTTNPNLNISAQSQVTFTIYEHETIAI